MDQREYWQSEAGRAARRRYRQTEKARIAARDRQRRARERYPERIKARMAVRNAITAGRLTRGECERVAEGSCRGDVEAHHDDYSKPLEVRWFCNKHHRKEDAMESFDPTGMPRQRRGSDA